MYTNDMTVITDYIAQQTEAVQPLLQHIYDLVHEEVSETVDGWKYGISTLLYKEKPLLGFAATKKASASILTATALSLRSLKK